LVSDFPDCGAELACPYLVPAPAEAPDWGKDGVIGPQISAPADPIHRQSCSLDEIALIAVLFYQFTAINILCDLWVAASCVERRESIAATLSPLERERL
jgi:hypothetical protein